LPDGIFQIPIWVHFESSCIGKCWYILWPFNTFYGHLVYLPKQWVYLVVIWYIYFPSFGIFYEEKSGNLAVTSRQKQKKPNCRNLLIASDTPDNGSFWMPFFFFFHLREQKINFDKNKVGGPLHFLRPGSNTLRPNLNQLLKSFMDQGSERYSGKKSSN
jgi:hypothetical protein